MKKYFGLGNLWECDGCGTLIEGTESGHEVIFRCVDCGIIRVEDIDKILADMNWLVHVSEDY